MKLTVTIATPWIATKCPWREKSREWTAAYWAKLGIPVVYGHDDSRPINRARARNVASLNVVCDVIAFLDADMFITAEAFGAMVERASETDRMVLGYENHMRLSKAATVSTLDGRRVLEGQTVRGAPGGAFAVSRHLLDTVGGHDERYAGWGFEDRSFMFACEVLSGPVEHIPGTSWHLWHPRGDDQIRTTPERREGLKLALRYKTAAGVKGVSGIIRATKNAELNREAMLALLREPGGPLHNVVVTG